MKNCRDFIRHFKFQIANAVCSTSVVALISNFSIVCIIKEIFYEIFSANLTYSSFCVCFLTLCLLLITFFSLLNLIILIACTFEDLQNFFIQSFLRYKVCLFFIWSNPQIVDIEHPQVICSPVFIVEDVCGLFAHPSILLTNHSSSAYLT